MRKATGSNPVLPTRMNDFRTLPSGKWQHILVVQKSRFLAFATRASSSAEAQAFLKSVALPDATHHCYAYITSDGQKSNDNGEPAGTAGLPILQAIKNAGLQNVVVAVERYFGGIKLGTGGLARAYGQAASQVLNSITPVLVRDCVVLGFDSNYEQQTAVAKLVAEHGKQLAVDYQNVVRWRVAVPVAKQNNFVNALAEVLHTVPEITVLETHAAVEFPD